MKVTLVLGSGDLVIYREVRTITKDSGPPGALFEFTMKDWVERVACTSIKSMLIEEEDNNADLTD